MVNLHLCPSSSPLHIRRAHSRPRRIVSFTLRPV